MSKNHFSTLFVWNTVLFDQNTQQSMGFDGEYSIPLCHGTEERLTC